jgi:hypothetical protein
MRINIDPKIGENGSWAQGIERANAILPLVVGRSSDVVTADWDLTLDERQRPLLALKLSDSSGSIEDRFHLEELTDSERLWLRLHHLWGDLLQDRSHKLLQELLEARGA